MTTPDSKCRLVIPWPRWATEPVPNPEQEHENYQALEQWVDHLLSDCLPAASGSTPVYCNVDSASVAVSGGGGFADGNSPLTISLSGSSTVKIDFAAKVPSTATGDWSLNAVVDSILYTTPVSQLNLGAVGGLGLMIPFTSAITLPAGSHTFGWEINASGVTVDASYGVQTQMTLVVGTDTGDTCLNNN